MDKDRINLQVDGDLLNEQRNLLAEMLTKYADLEYKSLWGLVSMLDAWYDEQYNPMEA